MTIYYDTLFINAHLATMDPKIAAPYGAIEDAALGVKDGRIAWLGKQADLPAHKSGQVQDCARGWVTPGLIDCHTHLVFSGNRAREFEMRLGGQSYAEIAEAGGGILSTLKSTRETRQSSLYHESVVRALQLIRKGVTTIEIKSGYGLDLKTERKMLMVAEKIATHDHVRICKTFLGAHALPPEFNGRSDAYIDYVCETMMPTLHRDGLIDAVDGFCETIGFSPAQIRRVFEKAKSLGLPVKLHAEQLSNQGGAKLAAEFGALSADHLEFIDEDGVKAMVAAGTVAVLLPGAFYFLSETQIPPINLFRKHKVPMALGTDCNPGSSPLTNPFLVLNMACTLFGFTPEEALSGMTREGAKALGLGEEIGTLTVGKQADLAIWDINHPAELSYWIDGGITPNRVFGGQICKS